jgi:hypothetical protein
LEENPKTGPANVGAGDDWEALVKLVQAVWDEGKIPTQLGWVVTVLIPKGGGDYCGIGLLEPIWKVIEQVIDKWLEAIALHDSLHGCRNERGTGTAVIEVKLSQQLSHIEQTPFYGVFIDLKKAFDAMDRERCLLLLEGHGAGPNMRRLIRHFWDDETTNVCRALGNYGAPFKAGRGVTQGGLLSAKLFNVLVDAVVREWLRLLREEMVMEEEELDEMMVTLFAIFYVDDAYITSRDPVFLQQAIDGLVSAFERVGLETNIKKTQAMTCTPGTIRLQLPTKSYLRMRTGRTPAAEWDARTVTCRECGKDIRTSSLGRHLADQHEIYQMQLVTEELLSRREGVVCELPLCCGKLKCPCRSTSDLPAAGGGQRAPQSARGCGVQGTVGCREAQMPVPPVQGGASKRVDDATAFPRPTPTSVGLRPGEEGREVPAMPSLQHAGGPAGSDVQRISTPRSVG